MDHFGCSKINASRSHVSPIYYLLKFCKMLLLQILRYNVDALLKWYPFWSTLGCTWICSPGFHVALWPTWNPGLQKFIPPTCRFKCHTMFQIFLFVHEWKLALSNGSSRGRCIKGALRVIQLSSQMLSVKVPIRALLLTDQSSVVKLSCDTCKWTLMSYTVLCSS